MLLRSLRMNPNALPLNGSMARAMLREEAEAENTKTGADATEITQKPRQPGELTEEDAKQVLIDKALEKGDQETVDAIQEKVPLQALTALLN